MRGARDLIHPTTFAFARGLRRPAPPGTMSVSSVRTSASARSGLNLMPDSDVNERRVRPRI